MSSNANKPAGLYYNDAKSSNSFDLYQHVMTSMKEAHATAIDNILKKEPQEA